MDQESLERLVEDLSVYGRSKVITLAYLKGYFPEDNVQYRRTAEISTQGYDTPQAWCGQHFKVSIKKSESKRAINTDYYLLSYTDLEREGNFEGAYLKATREKDPFKQAFYGNLHSFVRGCYIAIMSLPDKYNKMPNPHL